MAVHVDFQMCEKIGERLKAIKVLPDPYMRKPLTMEDKRKEAEFWLYIIAICHSTRTLRGVINGEWLRGGNYLLAASRKRFDSDPTFFSAERMRKITEEDLKAMLSDDGKPEHSTIDRAAERVSLLRDCAKTLLELFNGDVMQIYRISEGHLTRKDGKGICDLLRKFKAYADPIEKKTFLLVLYLKESGVWEIKDVENLKVAVDYHIMRVALRSGMVKVEDRDLREKLKLRKPATEDEDYEVRKAVREACSLVIKHSNCTVFEVDAILWNLGRSCCFYEHDPICGVNICRKRDKCTLIKAANYDCKGKCLLDGVCLGSVDEDYKRLWETNIYTTFY
jgi:hypothetical protein